MNLNRDRTGASTCSPLTLGTVQLGVPYGVANRSGQPDVEHANKILAAAWDGGITCFDTANIYGSAERLLGEFCKQQERKPKPIVISKLYLNADSSTSLKEFEDAVEKAIHETQERLQMDCIPGLLLHRPHVLAQFGSRLTDILQRHVKRGHVSKFGVSLLNSDPGPFAEMWPELQKDLYEIVQFPANAMDQRMKTNGVFDELRISGKLLFARSIYLQGLFFLHSDELPDHLKACGPWLIRLHRLAEQEGMSVAEFAFSYIRHMPGIFSIVFGAETVDQVRENVAMLDVPPIREQTIEELERAFAEVPEFVITPSLWKASK